MKKSRLEVGNEFGAEYAGTYEFREITWAKRNRIIQKYTRYHPMTGAVIQSDYVAIQAETVMASLKKQPKGNPVTKTKLLSDDMESGVPIAFGEKLATTVNKLCTVSRREQGFLEWPSTAEDLIKLLTSLGFVRNLDGCPKTCKDSPQKQS